MSSSASPAKGFSLAFSWLAMALAVSAVCARHVGPVERNIDQTGPAMPGTASTTPESALPSFEEANPYFLTLSTTGVSGEVQSIPVNFTLVPLTSNVGLNQTNTAAGIVAIAGQLKLAESSTYLNITGIKNIAFMSCDPPAKSLISPDMMLNALMGQNLDGIILYSISHTWCSLSFQGRLAYETLFSMTNSTDASNLYNYFNQSSNNVDVFANLNGRSNSSSSSGGSSDNGSSQGTPVIAMNVLYAVTALVSLLFLIVIVTGVLRAHRHPERYGPRGGVPGRPRQSRAKGLARALLDTIPIIKFGNQDLPAKPDPDIEMEPTAAAEIHESPSRDSPLDENGTTTQEATMTPANAAAPEAAAVSEGGSRPSSGTKDTIEEPPSTDVYHGCSICTEEFKNGEDVRVLPCNHQYHPECVDPWLLNVSGTCPLCRYDLRPKKEEAGAEASTHVEGELPPPLAIEGDDQPSTSQGQSSALDTDRLRQATVEERMQALREMRAQGAEQQEEQQSSDGDERRRGARFAAKLRDKFRIRTRAQQPERRE